MKAERSEILEDSGASGIESGVSERKPERKDERGPFESTESEDCDGECFGCVEESRDLGTAMVRVGGDPFELDVGGFGSDDKVPLVFVDCWRAASLALICALVAAESLNFMKALASSRIVVFDDGPLMMD